MVVPVQVDRFGQGNISMVGSDYARPKSMMLGCAASRQFDQPREFLLCAQPQHQGFVPGEVDAVGSVGYNPARLARGWTLEETTDIRFIFTNLCVMDFGGPSHQVRLVSLHPGVTAVRRSRRPRAFRSMFPESVGVTPDPTPEQLALLAQLDPHNLRATAMGV